MSKEQSFEIFAKLNTLQLTQLHFSRKAPLISQGEASTKIHFEVGLNADTNKQFFVNVEMHVDGVDPETKEPMYEAICKMVGVYSTDKDFKDHDQDMFSYAQSRGVLQIYPVVRKQMLSVLHDAGIVLNIDPQIDVNEVLQQSEQKGKTGGKKTKQKSS